MSKVSKVNIDFYSGLNNEHYYKEHCNGASQTVQKSGEGTKVEKDEFLTDGRKSAMITMMLNRENKMAQNLSVYVGNLATQNHLANTSANIVSSEWRPLGPTVLRLGRDHPLLIQVHLDVSVLLVRETEDSLWICVQPVHNILTKKCTHGFYLTGLILRGHYTREAVAFGW